MKITAFNKKLITQTSLIVVVIVSSWFLGYIFPSSYSFDTLGSAIALSFLLMAFAVLMPITFLFFKRKEVTNNLGKIFRFILYISMIPFILIALAEASFIFPGFAYPISEYMLLIGYNLWAWPSLLILIYLAMAGMMFMSARINKSLRSINK